MGAGLFSANATLRASLGCARDSRKHSRKSRDHPQPALAHPIAARHPSRPAALKHSLILWKTARRGSGIILQLLSKLAVVEAISWSAIIFGVCRWCVFMDSDSSSSYGSREAISRFGSRRYLLSFGGGTALSPPKRPRGAYLSKRRCAQGRGKIPIWYGRCMAVCFCDEHFPQLEATAGVQW